MKYFLLLSFFVFTALHAQWTNFRVYPSGITQTEVFAVRHPLQPNTIFASANTINTSNAFVSEGIYVSTDAGISWKGSDTCKGSPITFHKGDPGITIDKNGTFILTRLGFADGLYAHFSTDNGATWSSQRTIAEEKQDRAATISDTVSKSNFYGRTYTAYVEFLPPFPIKFSYSDNGGNSWSAPVAINNPPSRSQGAELSLGNNGEIFTTWAGVINSSPFTEDYIGFAVSTNGGASWNVKENIIDINGIQGTLAEKSNIRVNGLPKIDIDRSNSPRRGWLYIVTTQKKLSPAGNDPDIILYRSTDYGATWSNGIRVNQDAMNNGRIQYFPAIHIDEFGGVNILYYDDRKTVGDSASVFLSRSTDGGETWNDFQISDKNFKPKSIGGLGAGYQGDNISLTSVGNILLPFWMDNRSGIYQIWSARVPISSLVSVKELNQSIHKFELFQNYPNPFNPTTTITYTLSPNPSPLGRGEGVRVTLKIYDLLGKEIATLVNEMHEPGIHSFHFSSTNLNLSSGIYFYRLQAGNFSAVKKLTIIK